jgi:hypothetical protein
MRKVRKQTDGAACLALWRNEGRVESRPPRRRLKPRVALSPVCEPIGSTVKQQHHADEQQILYETGLETASNYMGGHSPLNRTTLPPWLMGPHGNILFSSLQASCPSRPAPFSHSRF